MRLGVLVAMMMMGAGLGCAREERAAHHAPAPREEAPAEPHDAKSAEGKSTDHAEPRSVARSMAEFRPSVHGFAFVNSFSGSSLPVDLGGAVEKKLGLPNRYGLCGGMSAAAADFFLAGKAVPSDVKPPVRGSALYAYLYSRQAASLGPMGAMALKYAEWMQLSDEEVGKRTRDELPRIVEMVGRGDVVVLGLVLEGAKGAAWDNHQVLAYGVVERGGGVDVKVYDPNYPKRDDVVIRVIDDGRVLQAARVGPGKQGRNVRGVFRMPYEPMVPRIGG